MDRPSKLRITKPHPNPRFGDKIRLLAHRRAPDDEQWAAAFHIDGKWTPVNGVALGTIDFEEARDLAVERYSKAIDGQRVARGYCKADGPKTTEHALEVYARQAITELEVQATDADATVKGKGHNYRTQISRPESLLPRWGQTDIRHLDEHDLNDWVKHELRVEDREATVAGTVASHVGRDGRSSPRNRASPRWALSLIWDEAVAAKVVERRRRPVNRQGPW
jgi:hypothetical protein